MLFRQITDPKLSQYAYLIGCQKTGEAIVIDPERDVDRYIAAAAAEGLTIVAATETHIHADFLSGVAELGRQTGAKIYLSANGGADWQYGWAQNDELDVRLLADGDSFEIGKIELIARHTPGHTPEHVSFLVVDHGGGMSEPMGLASGDFVFVGSLGRPDLLESAAGVEGAMEPSAKELYTSVHDFLELPDFLQVWPGHGAGSACGKALGAVPMSTVGYERRSNVAIDAALRGEREFIDMILDGQPEPPLYFARMKHLNQKGVPPLGSLPTPAEVTVETLAGVAGAKGSIVLDTRADRTAFMGGHVAGSIYAPLNKSFPTIAGSYARPEEEIYLIVESARVDEAVRDLVRIGLDRVVGFLPPEGLESASGLATTEMIDFARVAELKASEGDLTVLDVRGASEYAVGHVPESLNIAHTRLLDRLETVPSDGPVLVHCLSGARAASAVSLLERDGRSVFYIDDAFSKWASNQPVER